MNQDSTDRIVAGLRAWISTAPPGDLRERDVVVVGYPALDPRNAVDVQNRIFDGVFNVKRLQPGKLRDVESIRSFGHAVDAVTHDSSTLGGNSGSAVVDVKTGEVVVVDGKLTTARIFLWYVRSHNIW